MWCNNGVKCDRTQFWFAYFCCICNLYATTNNCSNHARICFCFETIVCNATNCQLVWTPLYSSVQFNSKWQQVRWYQLSLMIARKYQWQNLHPKRTQTITFAFQQKPIFENVVELKPTLHMILICNITHDYVL